MLRFQLVRSLQKFATVHASVYNHINQDLSITGRIHFRKARAVALIGWCQLGAA